MVTSNLTKPKSSPGFVAPTVATLPDDDPSEDDGDPFDEGRDDIEIMSSINAINIHQSTWSPSADVVADQPIAPISKDPKAY